MITCKVEKRVEVDTANIPDGKYPGLGGGSLVDFFVGDDPYVITIKPRMPGNGFPCTVKVTNGRVTVELD